MIESNFVFPLRAPNIFFALELHVSWRKVIEAFLARNYRNCVQKCTQPRKWQIWRNVIDETERFVKVWETVKIFGTYRKFDKITPRLLTKLYEQIEG